MVENTIDILDKLIEICRDGQEGYRHAAEYTKNTELKSFFEHQALQRANFAGELENEALHLGEADPDRGPSFANKLHCAWCDLKQKIGGGDVSVLESVEAGEANAKRYYQEALRSGLPRDVRDLVERQAQSIFAAHGRIRTLRDQRKRVA